MEVIFHEQWTAHFLNSYSFSVVGVYVAYLSLQGANILLTDSGYVKLGEKPSRFQLLSHRACIRIFVGVILGNDGILMASGPSSAACACFLDLNFCLLVFVILILVSSPLFQLILVFRPKLRRLLQRGSHLLELHTG